MKLNDFIKVYNALEDRESRDIYEAQVMFRYTGDWRYIGDYNINNKEEWHDEYEYAFFAGWDVSQMGDCYNLSVWDVIRNNMNVQKNEIVLFGAGECGKLVFRVLELYGIRVKCFCDNFKQGLKSFGGLQVLSVDECIKNKEAIFIACSLDYCVREAMRRQLLELGVDRTKIVLGHEYCGKQYFEPDILWHSNDEIFVDCGSENAVTCKQFANWAGSYKRIYTFEPNQHNLRECEKNIKKLGLENTILIPCGVWDERTQLSFVQNYGASKVDDTGDIKIDVAPLDELLEGVPVTFIKMDIEGSELHALRGARNLIKLNHPKLAICIYHKNEDFIEIPKYIKELYADYRLFVRRYSSGADEVVLYAV